MLGPTIPAVLEQVQIANFASPSALTAEPTCPLRRIARDPGTGRAIDGLIESPVAILGTELHRSLELGDGRANLHELFAHLISEREAELLDDDRRRHFVPLETSAGARSWTSALSIIEARAGTGPEFSFGAVARPAPTSGRPPDTTGADGTRHEEVFESTALRLRGKVDLLEHVSADLIRITDWKTGVVLDEEGEVKLDHRLQLAAYALMCKERWPDRQLETYLFDGGPVQVVLSDADFQLVHEIIETLFSGRESGALADAGGLASPGLECRYCPVRHRCPEYREVMIESGRGVVIEDPGPGDIFGIIESVRPEMDVANIRLANGELVQLRGLTERFDLADMVSRDVYCFGFHPRWSRHHLSGATRLTNTYEERRPTGRAWQAEIFIAPD